MDYDVCIIGAGWAGFNAALAAAKLGKKACIAEDREIGGTCLNRGCIPTKAFVHYSKSGLSLGDIRKKKDEVVGRLRDGMFYLIKSNKIDYFQGRALIKKDGSVSIGTDNIKPKYILLATGSSSKDLPNIKIDHKRIISSDDMLSLDAVPKKLLIVGGGVIGCEFASIFARLGSDVTIVEITGQLLPGLDAQVSKKLLSAFQKVGITVFLGKGAQDLDLNGFDKVLLSVGRSTVIDGLWEDGVGIKVDKGFIAVDRELKTAMPNIFAAGDCIGGYMLAHVASYEGELAVNNMFEKQEKRDYSVIPSSVFTAPEVGSVGLSEEEAKHFGASYKASSVHFLSVGMSHIFGDTQGFAKVIVDTKSGKILGAIIIGLQATELVNIFSVLIKNNITIFELKKTIFAHPSISEIVAEVAKQAL
jgi:dihydrolipoamide dehydrogenase